MRSWASISVISAVSACFACHPSASAPAATATASAATTAGNGAESLVVSEARLCVDRNAWRGVAGGSLVLEEPRRVLALDHGRYLVSFAEVPVTLQVPNGLDVYVDPGTSTCARAPME